MNKKGWFFVALTAVVGLSPSMGSADTRPDLLVSDLRLNESCQIVVTLRNGGPGTVPDGGFSMSPPLSSSLQMYKNNQPWGGIVLGGFDTTKQTKPVGGTLQKVWFPGAANLRLPPGAHTLKLTVDANNAIKESNETNNTLIRRVECRPPLPDLIVSDLQLNDSCQIVLSLRNTGSGQVPDAAYSHNPPGASGIQLYKGGQGWGGIVLVGFDTQKQLKSPGGAVTKVWFPGAANLRLPPGDHVVKAVVDNGNTIVESNEGNNTLERRLTCRRSTPTVPGDRTPGRLAPGR